MLLAVTNSILSYLVLNTHFQMSTLTAAAAAAAAFQTAADLCAETDCTMFQAAQHVRGG